jgi:hypothetical protein
MKRYIFIIIIIVLGISACEDKADGLMNLKDPYTIENAENYISIRIEKDSINPFIDRKVKLTAYLKNSDNEQDVMFRTDYGNLSASATSLDGAVAKELIVKTGGGIATAILNIDNTIDYNISVSVSITSIEDVSYSANKTIYLEVFKPDTIQLSMQKDSLAIHEYAVITAKLSSFYGKVSDNLPVEFHLIQADSVMSLVSPQVPLSSIGKTETIIRNQNHMPGVTKLYCKYEDVISDTLEVKWF